MQALADKIKMDYEDRYYWLRNEDSSKIEWGAKLDKCKYRVPNTVQLFLPKTHWPLSKWWLLTSWLVHKYKQSQYDAAMARWRLQITKTAHTYAKSGLYVEIQDFDNSGTRLNAGQSFKWPLYGLIVGGHGDESGDVRLSPPPNQQLLTPSVLTGSTLYKYGVLYIASCFAGAGSWKEHHSKWADVYIAPNRWVYIEYESVPNGNPPSNDTE